MFGKKINKLFFVVSRSTGLQILI